MMEDFEDEASSMKFGLIPFIMTNFAVVVVGVMVVVSCGTEVSLTMTKSSVMSDCSLFVSPASSKSVRLAVESFKFRV